MGHEIHERKCQVIHHIDAAQFVVEFQRVKGHELSVQLNDVGQVQVSVAFAKEALCASCQRGGRQSLGLFVGELPDGVHLCCELRRYDCFALGRCDSSDALQTLLDPVRGGSKLGEAFFRQGGQRLMKSGQVVSQPIDLLGTQPTGLNAFRQQVFLGKTVHAQEPVDGRARAVDLWGLHRTGDGLNGQVKGRCGALVD